MTKRRGGRKLRKFLRRVPKRIRDIHWLRTIKLTSKRLAILATILLALSQFVLYLDESNENKCIKVLIMYNHAMTETSGYRISTEIYASVVDSYGYNLSKVPTVVLKGLNRSKMELEGLTGTSNRIRDDLMESCKFRWKYKIAYSLLFFGGVFLYLFALFKVGKER